MRGSVACLLLLVSALFLSCFPWIPDTPNPPEGPPNGYVNQSYEYAASGPFPAGHLVGFRFSWGDGDTSDWTDSLPSADTFRLAHAWSETGTYEVRVQARTTDDRRTDWSGPMAVNIVARPGAPQGPRISFTDSLTTYEATNRLAEGYPLSFRFSWDDGDTSAWSDLVQPGDTSRTSHVWTSPGSREVRVQARNPDGVCTEWSSALPVDVRPFVIGTVKWRFPVAPGYRPTPAIGDDGTIYVASADCLLWALRPDCRAEWAARLPGRPMSAPAIGRDGTVHIDTEAGLAAVTRAGRLKWFYPLAHTWMVFRKDLAIGDDGTVYYSVEDSLVAVSRGGTRRWTQWLPDGGSMLGPVVGPTGLVVVTDYGYGVNAYLPDGNLAWERDLPSLGQCCFDGDGTIYVPSEDFHVYALSPEGETIWSYESAWHCFDAQPTIGSDGTVYATSWDCGYGYGKLHAIAPGGRGKWVTPRGWASSQSTPALAADGTIYVAGNDSLLALDTLGQRLWVCPVGDLREDQSPVVGPEGTVYIGETSSLVAICATSPPADSPWPMYQHDSRLTGRAGP